MPTLDNVLRDAAEDAGRRVLEKTYDYWSEQEFPVCYEDMFVGVAIEVEIVLLEKKERYLHLGIGISSMQDSASSRRPVCTSVIVRR